MLLVEPGRTQYDLHFQVLGFPVRIHPFFWLMSVITGAGGMVDGMALVIWMISIFISILIHELGHSIMMRRIGIESHIVLYMMGGLAIEGRDDYGGYGPRAPRTPQDQILISFAGPAAGFCFALLLALILKLSGGDFVFIRSFPMFWEFTLPDSMKNEAANYLFHFLFFVNIYWGLMNLLPVFPLDGGQIALQVLMVKDPWQGTERALWLSVITSGLVVVYGAMHGDNFLVILFLSLGVNCYFTIQQHFGGRGRPW